MLEGIRTVGPVRVHHGGGLGQRTLALMMVGDHHVQPQGGGKVNFLRPGDAAVHRHHQRGPLLPKGLNGLPAQAVAVLNAPGNIPQAGNAAVFEIVQQQHGGGNAVHVVVAKDSHGFPVRNGAANALHGLIHVRHGKGRESQRAVALQPLGGLLRGGDAPARQHRGQQRGISRLTQRFHRARGGRSDVPLFKFHHGSPPSDKFCGTVVLFSKITPLLYQSSTET
ncbi:hypothetical protein SDC9_156022 [bioreactor metagenome]|uniref:Uncharacterized protein n=1 Tax=bioreactor metagenome TaxID=1076179 RepID=A0A645F3L0_9ZZZZ